MWQADAVALADRMTALLTAGRSIEAQVGSLLAEIESRGVMELFGYRSVARLFEHLADVPKAAAETVVKRARALNAGRNLDGTPVPAVAPATGVAASDGRLSNPMIDTIVSTLTQVPPEHCPDVEQDLLSFAADAGHKQVAALGARIVAHLDPDGAEPDSRPNRLRPPENCRCAGKDPESGNSTAASTTKPAPAPAPSSTPSPNAAPPTTAPTSAPHKNATATPSPTPSTSP